MRTLSSHATNTLNGFRAHRIFLKNVPATSSLESSVSASASASAAHATTTPRTTVVFSIAIAMHIGHRAARAALGSTCVVAVVVVARDGPATSSACGCPRDAFRARRVAIAAVAAAPRASRRVVATADDARGDVASAPRVVDVRARRAYSTRAKPHHPTRPFVDARRHDRPFATRRRRG